MYGLQRSYLLEFKVLLRSTEGSRPKWKCIALTDEIEKIFQTGDDLRTVDLSDHTKYTLIIPVSNKLTILRQDLQLI